MNDNGQAEETQARESVPPPVAHRCSVFLGNEFLGEAWCDAYREGMRVVPQSLHFFCSRCGDIWARIVADAVSSQHSTITRTCSNCFDPRYTFLHNLPIFFQSNSRYERPPRLPQAAMRYDLLWLFANLEVS